MQSPSLKYLSILIERFLPGAVAPIFWSAGRADTQSFDAVEGLQADGAVFPFSIPMHWEI